MVTFAELAFIPWGQAICNKAFHLSKCHSK